MRVWTSAIVVMILAQGAVGCRAAPAASSGPAATQAADTTTAVAEAPRSEFGFFTAPLDTVEGWIELDPAAVNLEVERAWKVGMDWPARAFDVGLRAVGEIDARTTALRLEHDRTEGPSIATLVVTQVGFADDSIGGLRDEIDLALQLDGSWRVVTHWRSVFCPRGPGRGAWMAGPCH